MATHFVFSNSQLTYCGSDYNNRYSDSYTEYNKLTNDLCKVNCDKCENEIKKALLLYHLIKTHN